MSVLRAGVDQEATVASSLSKSAPQTVASGPPVALTGWAADADSAGWRTPDGAGMTVPVGAAGRYSVKADVTWASRAGATTVFIVVNSTAVSSTQERPGDSATQRALEHDVTLTDGDVVTVEVSQASGADASVASAALAARGPA